MCGTIKLEKKGKRQTESERERGKRKSRRETGSRSRSNCNNFDKGQETKQTRTNGNREWCVQELQVLRSSGVGEINCGKFQIGVFYLMAFKTAGTVLLGYEFSLSPSLSLSL